MSGDKDGVVDFPRSAVPVAPDVVERFAEYLKTTEKLRAVECSGTEERIERVLTEFFFFVHNEVRGMDTEHGTIGSDHNWLSHNWQGPVRQILAREWCRANGRVPPGAKMIAERALQCLIERHAIVIRVRESGETETPIIPIKRQE